MIWNLDPLLTDDFEVMLSFTANGVQPRHFLNDGFAFWYVYENGTEAHYDLARSHGQNQEAIIGGSWQKEFLAQGMDLLQYRSGFNGLGVFFLTGLDPSVSAIVGDGRAEHKLGAGVPAANAVKFDLVGGQEVTAKVRVQPQKAQVEIVGHGSFEVTGAFRPGGFVGLTAFGGATEPLDPKTQKSAFIELRRLDAINHKQGVKGEERRKVVQGPVKTAEQKEDVLREASSFKDHRAESDAIKDLTNMVFKLVVESQPLHQQMERAIQTLTARVENFEKVFANVRALTEQNSGHANLKEEFAALKQDLASLVSDTSKDSRDRRAHLENLHSDIIDVHKSAHSPDTIHGHLSNLSVSNHRVLDQLTTEHQKMFGVSIAAIAFIVIAGLSLYNKFRCWEKKHIL